MNPIQRFGRWVRSLATWRDNSTWLHEWVSMGNATASGERVNAHSALSLSTYFAAIRAISEDVAKLPLKVYRRRGDTKSEVPNHALSRILGQSPNDDMTAISFRETLTAHALGWGDGYAEIIDDPSGEVGGLNILEPDTVQVDRDSTDNLVYEVRERDTGQTRRLARWRVFHLHGLSFNGIRGYSAATLARQSIGLGLALEKSGAALFGNNGRPGGVLKHPGVLEGESRKRFEESWKSTHGGGENMHKTAVLEQGMDYMPIAVPNKDAQWIEARQFLVEDLCRWLRIPPHKVQHLLRATFSNIEAQAIEYLQDTLLPWLVRWEQEISRKLIRQQTRGLFAEHVIAGILRGDIQTRYGAYATGRQWGWLSVNDVRRFENMNPIGEDGDMYLVPSNMTTPEKLLEEPEPQPNPFVDAPPDEDEEEEDNETAASIRLIVGDEIRAAMRDDTGSDANPIAAIARAHLPALEGCYAKTMAIEVQKFAQQPEGERPAWARDYYRRREPDIRATLNPVVDTFAASCWSLTAGGDVPVQVWRGRRQHLEQGQRRGQIRVVSWNTCRYMPAKNGG